MKVPASTKWEVLAKEIRNLEIKRVKYMKPIILKGVKHDTKRGKA